MKARVNDKESFIIDTYKLSDKGVYLAGAILFKGRKKIDVLRWHQQKFYSQQAADSFVRDHFRGTVVAEMANEGELPRYQ